MTTNRSSSFSIQYFSVSSLASSVSVSSALGVPTGSVAASSDDDEELFGPTSSLTDAGEASEDSEY